VEELWYDMVTYGCHIIIPEGVGTAHSGGTMV
jgi:hypothetical protein